MCSIPSEIITIIVNNSIEIALILALTAKSYNAILQPMLANKDSYITTPGLNISVEMAKIYFKYTLTNAIINNPNNSRQITAILAMLVHMRSQHIIKYKVLCKLIMSNCYSSDTSAYAGYQLLLIHKHKAAQATLSNFYVTHYISILNVLYYIIRNRNAHSIDYVTRVCALLLVKPTRVDHEAIMKLIRFSNETLLNDNLVEYIKQIPHAMVTEDQHILHGVAQIVANQHSPHMLDEFNNWQYDVYLSSCRQ